MMSTLKSTSTINVLPLGRPKEEANTTIAIATINSISSEATLLQPQTRLPTLPPIANDHASMDKQTHLLLNTPSQQLGCTELVLSPDNSLSKLEQSIEEYRTKIPYWQQRIQDHIGPTPTTLSITAHEKLKGWHDALERLKKKDNIRTVIGVMGDTGVGKSSVINALLDEELLLPQNAMRACTAVITEISYNHSFSHLYRAEVEFITPSDWEWELRKLFADLKSNQDGNIKVTNVRKDSEAEIALAKIKAVYPQKTTEHLMITNPEELMQDTRVMNLLGTTITIEEMDSVKFCGLLHRYIDNGKDREKVMEFWPLIKVVRVYCKSHVLSTGAVLVDLPGSHDSNPARAAIAARYIQKCNGLWIVAPVTRAVDDRTAYNLLGETFRRQLLMDGGFNCVSFICSKTDDISVTEVSASLGLESDLEAQNMDLELVEEKIKELEEKEKSLKAMRQRLMEDQDDISDRLDYWEGLREAQAPKGLLLLEPMRGHMIKDQTREETPEETPENLDSAIVSNGFFNISTRFNAQGTERDLDENHIQDMITKLKGSQKVNRQEYKNTRNKLLEVQNELSEFKHQQVKLQNDIETYCIKTRNSYSTEAIQADFATGLQELDMEAMEKQDSENFNPMAAAMKRDYTRVAKDFPVFCVSSRSYQKFKGRFKKDRDPQVFSTIEDTGLPALQQHCMQMTENMRCHASRYFWMELCGVLSSLSLWETVQANETPSSGFTVDEEDFDTLEEDFSKSRDQTINDVRQFMEQRLFNRMSTGADNAAKSSKLVASNWKRLHWNTYQAVCHYKGVFSSKTRVRLVDIDPNIIAARLVHIDFNADLNTPLTRVIAAEWDLLFSRVIPSYLECYVKSCGANIQQFHHSVREKARVSGSVSDLSQLEILERLHLPRYNEKLSLTGTSIQQDITSSQRGINREFYSVVQKKMLRAYKYCASQNGEGRYQRMKERMERHIEKKGRSMFVDATELVHGQLDEMLKVLEGNLDSAVNSVLKSVRQDYNLLGGGSRAV